ncbi:uncharacterized protein [Penaeus vannamei]|uniref:uncharacterized protein n=1 Tax=Penaeus vannamei TaxID=6689 RepID=UPI00387F8E60
MEESNTVRDFNDQPEVSITIENGDFEASEEERWGCEGRACIVIDHREGTEHHQDPPPQSARLTLTKTLTKPSKHQVRVIPVRLKQERIEVPEMKDIPEQHTQRDREMIMVESEKYPRVVEAYPNNQVNFTTRQPNVLKVWVKQEVEDVQAFHEVRDVKPDIRKLNMSLQSRREDADSTIDSESYVIEEDMNSVKKEGTFQCEVCDRTYFHLRTLESHKKICGKESKLRKTKCIDPLCEKEFFHKFRMIEHFERNHISKKEPEQALEFDRRDSEFACPRCHELFSQVSALRIHQRTCGKLADSQKIGRQDGKKKIRCIYPDCKKEFFSRALLNQHVEQCHPDIKVVLKPASHYECDNCHRGFTYFSSFQTHRKSCGEHSKLSKTRCVHPSCKKEFFHKCRLIQHLAEDHPEMDYKEPKLSFKCPRCDREYLYLRSMRTHAKVCGKKGKLKKSQCISPSCTREYFHKSRLAEHIKKDHPEMVCESSMENELRCQNCNTVYRNIQSLQRHKEMCGKDEKLKKTQCIHPACEKKFFHISSMMKHVENDHTDLEISVVEKHFQSIADFKLWKEDEELRSFSYFSTRHSVTSSEGKVYLSYVCQYNGPDRYPSTPGELGRTASRKWKKGRVKTGLVCPARMLVKELSDGTVNVKYVQTHNHDIDKDNFSYPPFAHRSYNRYLPQEESCEKNEVGYLESQVDVNMDVTEAVETPEAAAEENIVSGEIIAKTEMDADYFDYMLKPNCGYVLSVDRANEVVNLFQQRTSSRFTCYKVQRSFGRDEWSVDNRKILWQQEETRENTLPEFDGVPYILNGTKVLECQYGVNRSAYQKKNHLERKKNDLWKEDEVPKHISKKVDCPAKIFLKDVIKFPDFKVDINSREAKKLKSNNLRTALKEEQVFGERRIYIQLPKESDHCNHRKGPTSRPRKQRSSRLSLLPTWDTELNDGDFLQTFRVTKPVYQILVDEWHRVEAFRLEAAGLPADKVQPLDQLVLAGLYYLGSTDNLSMASAKFKVKAGKLFETVVMFADFLLGQQEKYLKWPPVEERVKVAEVIKHDCGFPGVFGALDAALIHMMAPAGDDRLNYAYITTEEESKYGFVLQFIVDHRLVFRDIHLDAPKTGTRFQVFQESDAWITIQNLTSAETHLVAPAVYPLAPAVMTPHMTETLTYQEALFNENHNEAQKLSANAMTVFKSRFRRMQLLDRHVETNGKLIRAACILHNIALMNENEMVLNELGLEYNSELDEEGWHTVGMEEVVAEIGILGGEEKRRYLTTVMTSRY